MEILFVCTGNTCRSPMAQALFIQMLAKGGIQDVNVSSAGIAAVPGNQASANALKVAPPPHLDEHSARQVAEHILASADLVLTMTVHQSLVLGQDFPHYKGKIYTLSEFAGNEHSDISDPFGLGVPDYEATREQIRELLVTVYERLFGDNHNGGKRS